nr:MAG TPA: hypothetical protein [Caudoviricetes sp.]
MFRFFIAYFIYAHHISIPTFLYYISTKRYNSLYCFV